jgi:hypothetical protein
MLDERVALVQEKNASLGGDVVTGVTGEEVQWSSPSIWRGCART